MNAPGGTRTPNLLIRSQLLYPLSYGRIKKILTFFLKLFNPYLILNKSLIYIINRQIKYVIYFQRILIQLRKQINKPNNIKNN